jgi:hypothetical protein
MKKILFTFCFGIVSFMAPNKKVDAQNMFPPVTYTGIKNFKASVREIAALESLSELGNYIPDVKNINNRAHKDFETRFKNAGSSLWFSDKNGLVSYFIRDGYGDRAFYDKKGRWQYSLIFYNEDKLPTEIRTAVKTTYFDMSISVVEEVQTADIKVYIVHLEDKSEVKILKVSAEGEASIIDEWKKEKY